MAHLLGYKRKHDNRYRTFSNISFGASTDTLTFKKVPKAKVSANIMPHVHKKPEKKGSQNESIKSRKQITCCWKRKWVRRILCCSCLCYRCPCKRKNVNSDNEDDIDRAVVEFRKQQGMADEIGSQKSTLKSENGQGGNNWRWDDSWQSNCDKFLETLEFDCVGSDKSLKRAADKLRNSKVRNTAIYGNIYNLNGGGF